MRSTDLLALAVLLCTCSVLGQQDDVSLSPLSDTRKAQESYMTFQSFMSSNNTSNCSVAINSALSHLSERSDCITLIGAVKNYHTPNRTEASWMCASTCWDDLLSQITKISSLGCKANIRPRMLKEICPDPEPSPSPSQLPTQTSDETPTATPIPDPDSPSPSPSPLFTCLKGCSGHGQCLPVSQGSELIGVCKCDKGYGWQGTRLPFIPTFNDKNEDCAEYTLALCPKQCAGHGACVKNGTAGAVKCQCYDGFSGDTCEHWSRCTELKQCSGAGNCTVSYGPTATTDVSCQCFPGYLGETCSDTYDHCTEHCLGRGTCRRVGPSRACECDARFTGNSCELVTGPFCLHNCSALGSCTSNLTCACVEGATGEDCSVITNPCVNCNKGYCRGKKCECLSGYQGEHCEVYNATADTACQKLKFCHGAGVCTFVNKTGDKLNYKCNCFQGFSGDECKIVDANYLTECPNYCSGHGRCALLDTPHCVCNPGWGGKDCSESLCPKDSNGKICSDRGVCELESPNKFVCTCDLGYAHGALKACESTLCPRDCSGHGKCSASGECTCDNGYAGVDCSRTLSNAKRKKVSMLASSSKSHSSHKSESATKAEAASQPSINLPSLFDNDDLDNLDLLEIDGEVGERSMSKLWD